MLIQQWLNLMGPKSGKIHLQSAALWFVSTMLALWYDWGSVLEKSRSSRLDQTGTIRVKLTACYSWWARPRASKVIPDLHRCCLTRGLLPGWPQPPRLQSAVWECSAEIWEQRLLLTLCQRVMYVIHTMQQKNYSRIFNISFMFTSK